MERLRQADLPMPHDSSGFVSSILLHLQLAALPQHNLRRSPVLLDQAGHADSPIFQFGLRLTELRSVISPDQRDEDLSGVRFVKIEECRLSLRARCVVRRRHATEDSRGLPGVLLRFGCRDLLR